MDSIEPTNVKPKPVGFPPLTEEWFLQQKRLLKQAKMESQDPTLASDVSSLSPEAECQLPNDKYESFLENAKSHISKMDKNSSSFLPEATSKLVSSALEQEYGQEIVQNPGYPQMKTKLTKKILKDPKYKEIVEEFLELLSFSEQPSQK